MTPEPDPCPSSPCPDCTTAATGRPTPTYRLTCLPCCARLVLSAHPMREQAAGLLAAIARVPHAPSRAAVLAAVRQAQEGA